MSFPKMTEPVNNISQLDTRPNAVNGLTADQLKAEFDKGPQAIKKFLNEVLIPALDGAVTLEALGAVPNTRTVARKALSADILLDESDIDYDGTIDGTRVQGDLGDAIDTIGQKLGNAVPNTRTVNGKTLAQDIRLGASDIDYSGKIGEYEASNVGGAIEALAAKKELAVFSAYLSGEMSDNFSSAATFPEISAAYEAGKQIWLDVYSQLTSLHRLIPLTFFNTTAGLAIFSASGTGNRTMLAKLTYDSRATPQNTWEYSNSLADADDVRYDGKIGNTSVHRVKTALDLLSVGNPLDMTADYTASGATSVEQWATMAKVVDGVASTTEYRIAQGRYRVTKDANGAVYDVTVTDVPDGTGRIVLISSVNSDPYWYFDVCSVTAPGSKMTSLLYLSTEEDLFQMNGLDVKLPTYNDATDSADNGKLLMLRNNGRGVFPKWEVPGSADVVYDGKVADTPVSTVKAALDTLAIGNPLDMTADYTASGATSVEQWATMAKVVDGVASTTEYRIAPGRYRIVSNDGYKCDLNITHTDGCRMVSIFVLDNDISNFNLCYVDSPGGTPIGILYFSIEDRCLNFGNYSDNYLLPFYDNNGSYGGNVLRISEASSAPVWEQLNADVVRCAMNNAAAHNVQAAIDELNARDDCLVIKIAPNSEDSTDTDIVTDVVYRGVSVAESARRFNSINIAAKFGSPIEVDYDGERYPLTVVTRNTNLIVLNQFFTMTPGNPTGSYRYIEVIVQKTSISCAYVDEL